MKIISTVFIIGVAAMLLLAVGKNMVAKVAVESIGSAMVGSKLTIEKLDIGLLSSKITVHNLKLHNPRRSKDPVMADIPEVYVSYEASTLFSGKPHLKELRIDLREFLVVKNEKGELNVKTLNPSPPLVIDLLRLKVEKVVYKNYSDGDSNPEAHEFNIHLDESYRNVSDINSIAPLIASKALSEMKQLILGKIGAAGEGIVSGAANRTGNVVDKASDKVTQGIKNIFGVIKR